MPDSPATERENARVTGRLARARGCSTSTNVFTLTGLKWEAEALRLKSLSLPLSVSSHLRRPLVGTCGKRAVKPTLVVDGSRGGIAPYYSFISVSGCRRILSSAYHADVVLKHRDASFPTPHART